MSSPAAALRHPQIEFGSLVTASGIKLLYAVVSASDYVFLAALTAMLFRPPDLKALPIDRIAFATLLCVAGLRLVLYRQRLHTYSATWPLGALLVLGLWGVVSQSYDAQAWSLLAAKWIVPFALFHLAGVIFRSEASRRKLEWFSIAILSYLALISVLYLLGLKSLIIPRYILDESIGIHIDRARGPFLQAVANGVCLNIFALVAMHSFRRRRVRGMVGIALLLLVPLAILCDQDPRCVAFGAADDFRFAASCIRTTRPHYGVGSHRDAGNRGLCRVPVASAVVRLEFAAGGSLPSHVSHGNVPGGLGDVRREAAYGLGK